MDLNWSRRWRDAFLEFFDRFDVGRSTRDHVTVDYGGKKYEYRVTDADLQKTPAWAPGQENPPLPVRRAIDAATKQLAMLLPNARDWQLAGVTLRPLENHWVYVVDFQEPPKPAGGDRQVSSGFQVVVLMSGIAMVPSVSR